MTRDDLKNKLDELGVSPLFYSLDGTSHPDRLIRCPLDGKWLVFYVDERGGQHDEVAFDSEDAANEYVFCHFQQQKNVFE